MDCDCIIVGGGIGGAVLALILGRQERHVILLERELRPPSRGRPEVLAGATLEVFHKLGIGPRIEKEAAVPLEGLELYRAGGGRILSFGISDFEAAGARLFSTDPTRSREILLEEAA